ncbi:14253_t:CDS:1, partial [Dentiscutata heterogama]
SASEEKNKKKTQMRHHIAKKLSKTKESELTEQELNEENDIHFEFDILPNHLRFY